MTLANTLTKILSDWKVTERTSIFTQDKESGWAVKLTADLCDSLGCRLIEAQLRQAQTVQEQDLQEWAEAVCQRASSALEPMNVIEIDVPRKEAILRSATPITQDDKIFYFEIFLRGTRDVTFKKFEARFASNFKRQQVSFVLTHDAVAKVLSAIVGAE
ncbi:MAG: hypothetical protein ACFCD0_10850 [Gemmataceae bacterium]